MRENCGLGGCCWGGGYFIDRVVGCFFLWKKLCRVWYFVNVFVCCVFFCFGLWFFGFCWVDCGCVV